MNDIKPEMVDGEAVCCEDEDRCVSYAYYDGPRCAKICGGEVMWLDDNDPNKHYPCWPYYPARVSELEAGNDQLRGHRDRLLAILDAGHTSAEDLRDDIRVELGE